MSEFFTALFIGLGIYVALWAMAFVVSKSWHDGRPEKVVHVRFPEEKK